MNHLIITKKAPMGRVFILCILYYLQMSVTTAWMSSSLSSSTTTTRKTTIMCLRLQTRHPIIRTTRATTLSGRSTSKSTIIGDPIKSRQYQRSLPSSSSSLYAVEVVNANNGGGNYTINNEMALDLIPVVETSTITTTADEDDEFLLMSAEQKIINILFLSIAFGYAIYTILNIDNGMTRGWSTSEISMRIPLDNWGAYESNLANKPIVTKTLINVIIYLLGDWLSQTAFQKKNLLNFDIKRTLRNGFIGLCFGPLVHQYYEFSDAILPAENGLIIKMEKILMDQTIYLSVKCSVYISAVGLLAGEDLSTVTKTVKDKIGGIMLTAWKFWPIVHCITYSVIPAQHRILWVNSVDLVWNAILATQAQSKEIVPDEIDDVEEQMMLQQHVNISANTTTTLTTTTEAVVVT